MIFSPSTFNLLLKTFFKVRDSKEYFFWSKSYTQTKKKLIIVKPIYFLLCFNLYHDGLNISYKINHIIIVNIVVKWSKLVSVFLIFNRITIIFKHNSAQNRIMNILSYNFYLKWAKRCIRNYNIKMSISVHCISALVSGISFFFYKLVLWILIIRLCVTSFN